MCSRSYFTDSVTLKLDDALVTVHQLHYSLPPLDQKLKPVAKQHLEELAEATRRYYGLLKQVKERAEARH
jgi:hypothetical protein